MKADDREKERKVLCGDCMTEIRGPHLRENYENHKATECKRPKKKSDA